MAAPPAAMFFYGQFFTAIFMGGIGFVSGNFLFVIPAC